MDAFEDHEDHEREEAYDQGKWIASLLRGYMLICFPIVKATTRASTRAMTTAEVATGSYLLSIFEPLSAMPLRWTPGDYDFRDYSPSSLIVLRCTVVTRCISSLDNTMLKVPELRGLVLGKAMNFCAGLSTCNVIGDYTCSEDILFRAVQLLVVEDLVERHICAGATQPADACSRTVATIRCSK